MTPAQEAIAKLQASAIPPDGFTWKDPEDAHVEADQILCKFIRAIGHVEVADAFEAVRDHVGFWYA